MFPRGFKMKNKENYIIEECRHCGNKTKLDIMGKYTEYGDPEYDYAWCNKVSALRMTDGAIISGNRLV